VQRLSITIDSRPRWRWPDRALCVAALLYVYDPPRIAEASYPRCPQAPQPRAGCTCLDQESCMEVTVLKGPLPMCSDWPTTLSPSAAYVTATWSIGACTTVTRTARARIVPLARDIDIEHDRHARRAQRRLSRHKTARMLPYIRESFPTSIRSTMPRRFPI
jgi:hypothetical protein